MATATTAAAIPIPSTFPSSLGAIESSMCDVTKPANSGAFALTQLYGDQVCLVKLHASTSGYSPGSAFSALSAVEATIYRHEFINIFRHSHAAVLHPADVRILEHLDAQSVASDDESGTVFLARDVMARLGALTDPRRRASYHNARGSRVLAPQQYPRGLGCRRS